MKSPGGGQICIPVF